MKKKVGKKKKSLGRPKVRMIKSWKRRSTSTRPIRKSRTEPKTRPRTKMALKVHEKDCHCSSLIRRKTDPNYTRQ